MGAKHSQHRNPNTNHNPIPVEVPQFVDAYPRHSHWSDADIRRVFYPEDLQVTSDNSFHLLYHLVSDPTITAQQFGAVLKYWVPQTDPSELPGPNSLLTNPSSTHQDSLLVTLLKNRTTKDYDRKVALLLDYLPYLVKVKSYDVAPRDVLSQAFKAQVPADTLLLLLNRGVPVIRYDPLMRTTLFYLIESGNIDPVVLDRCLWCAQREIDQMKQLKRLGRWDPPNPPPRVAKYSLQDVEPEDVHSFVSTTDLHSNTLLATAIKKQLDPHIIMILFRFIDPKLVENLWDSRDSQARPSLNVTSFVVNALGHATAIANNFPTVCFLASRGLFRPRPLKDQFIPMYRFCISFFAQLRFPYQPQHESALHSLFCHYNPLINTVFRLGALTRPFTTLDIYFYTMMLGATQKLQKYLQLFQWLPDTSIQEVLFSEIELFTRYMRHLPLSWNNLGLQWLNVQQLLEQFIDFPSLPQSFFTSSPTTLQAPPQLIFKGFSEFIDSDWFANQIDANVAAHFDPESIKTGPDLSLLQDNLTLYASLQPTLDKEGYAISDLQLTRTITPTPRTFVDNFNTINPTSSSDEWYFSHYQVFNSQHVDFTNEMKAKAGPFEKYFKVGSQSVTLIAPGAGETQSMNVYAESIRQKRLLNNFPIKQTQTRLETRAMAKQAMRDNLHQSPIQDQMEDLLKEEIAEALSLDCSMRSDEVDYNKYSTLLRIEAGLDVIECDQGDLRPSDGTAVNLDDPNLSIDQLLSDFSGQVQPTSLENGRVAGGLSEDETPTPSGGNGCPHPGSKFTTPQSSTPQPQPPRLKKTANDETPSPQHFMYKQLVNAIMYQYYLIWKAWSYFQTVNNPMMKGSTADVQELRATSLFHKVCHSGLLLEQFFQDNFPQTYDVTITSIPGVDQGSPDVLMGPGEDALKEYATTVYADYFYPYKPLVTSTTLPFKCANGAPLISLAFLDHISIVTSGVVFAQPTELLTASSSDQYYQYLGQLFAARQQQYHDCAAVSPKHGYIINPTSGLANPFCLSPYEIPQPGATVNFDLKTVPGLLWWVLYYTPSPNYDDLITLITHCRTDILNHFGQSLLMIAIAKGWNFSSLATLARRMVNINLQDVYGRTALHYFALSGAFLNVPELLEFMLFELGAVLNIVDAFGHSPLTYAIYNQAPDALLMKLITYTLTRTAKQVEVYYSFFEPVDTLLNPSYDERFLNPRPYVVQPRLKPMIDPAASKKFHIHDGLPTTVSHSSYIADSVMYQHLPLYNNVRTAIEKPMSINEKRDRYGSSKYRGLISKVSTPEEAASILTVRPQTIVEAIQRYQTDSVVPDPAATPKYPADVTTVRDALFKQITGADIQAKHEAEQNAATAENVSDTPKINPITLESMINKGCLNFPWNVNHLLHTSYANNFVQPFVVVKSEIESYNRSVEPSPHTMWTLDELISLHWAIFTKDGTVLPRYSREIFARKPAPLDSTFPIPTELDFYCDKLLLNTGILLNIFELMIRCRASTTAITYLVQCITYALFSIEFPHAIYHATNTPLTSQQLKEAKQRIQPIIERYIGKYNMSASWYQHRVHPMEIELEFSGDLPELFTNTKSQIKNLEPAEWQKSLTENSAQRFLTNAIPAMQSKFLSKGFEAGIDIFKGSYKR